MKNEKDGGILKLNLLGCSLTAIPLYPKLRAITGKIEGVLILTLIIKEWYKAQGKKFYKFKQPCTHMKYRIGDSWCEELTFTVEEFDTAIKHFGFKKGAKNKLTKDKSAVWYYTDEEGLTYYELNIDYLNKKLIEIDFN